MSQQRLDDRVAAPQAYAALETQFSAKKIVELTTLIGEINLWNRLAIGLRAQHPVAAAT